MKNIWSYRTHKDVKFHQSAIFVRKISHFSQAIFKLVREVVIINTQNKFEQDTWKTKSYHAHKKVKCDKSR